MPTTTIIVLFLGALFLAVKLVHLVRLWADIRRNRISERAAELAVLADAARVAADPARVDPGTDDDTGTADLGVALALALRDAEADAQGKWSTLDSP